ncbi:hypothetical protein ACRU43_22610 [Mycobacterium colombiense]|uniref:hypothetical protein n=1 Tax=Mycobacterium colombiense TaxID=339268 RepID=UPI000B2F92C1|nr:hypothetical protein [Mycobacterium colombiense]
MTAVPTGWPVGAADAGVGGADEANCGVEPTPLVVCTACPEVLLVHAVAAIPAAAMLTITATAHRLERIPKAYDERPRVGSKPCRHMIRIVRRHTLMPCVVINEEEKELSEGQ